MNETMELTDEQKKIHDSVLDFVRCNKSSTLTIGGYAGTGKTTLIGAFSSTIRKEYPHKKIAFVTYTGKASSVLKSKLSDVGIYDDSDSKSSNQLIGTIHHLMYSPKWQFDKELNKMMLIGWSKTDSLDADLIIIDEASMVSGSIYKDLTDYNIPIIAVGDHGQLPPVENTPTQFNLMDNPDFRLETIHRVAQDNPIIKLSIMARTDGKIPYGIYSPGVFKVPWKDPKVKELFFNTNFDSSNTICLCGFNKSRVGLTQLIRKKLKYSKDYPELTERIICLKNNYSSGIMNGQIGSVYLLEFDESNNFRITAQMDGCEEMYTGNISQDTFGQESYSIIYEKSNNSERRNKHIPSLDYFDFGYVISVHKSQGSQWPKVVLFEERSSYWDDDYYSKWLYTGVTRSSEKLMIIR